jgi:regulator of protease activity HflC (stomatin/prohibitin superfamily)
MHKMPCTPIDNPLFHLTYLQQKREDTMIWLILGFLVALFGVIVGKTQTSTLSRLRNVFIVFGIALAGIGLLLNTIKQVESGTVGIKRMFGAIQQDVLYEGLHVINPLVDLTRMDTRTQNYTMSGQHDEGQKAGDDAIRVLSADGLEVTVDLTILYKVNAEKAPEIVRSIGMDYEERIVRPVTRTRIRESAVYYNAVDLYSTRREAFEQRIRETIDKDFATRGLILENMLVRNITLPPAVKESIERKITAEQDAQRMEFILAKGRQEAELKRVEAHGIADAQRILSLGLTDKILQFEQIKVQKELANSPNAKIIIMGSKSAPLILDTK